MKLDRNVEGGHGNKYGLIKNRRIEELRKPNGALPGDLTEALLVLNEYGILDWGCTPETEFFVIRLKDKGANPALAAYSGQYYASDKEYSDEVFDLSKRSGIYHPNCKAAD
jgi:hypothetical protein